MNHCSDIIGVVLAGGQSTRMHTDKARLIINQTDLLTHQMALLKQLGCVDVLVSRNEPSANYIHDIYPNGGPMAGIYSVMKYCEQHLEPHPLLIIGVDMPLLDTTILAHLTHMGCSMQCSLHYEQQPLPLYLLNNAENRYYAKSVVQDPQNKSIQRFLNIITSAKIRTEQVNKLVNTNTPEQWQQVLAAMQQPED